MDKLSRRIRSYEPIMYKTGSRRATLIALAVLLCMGGCGGPRNVTVTGTVVRNGQPLAPSPTGVVQITLVPDVPQGTPYTTYVGRPDAAGKFEILEVPPGKYRVAVEQLDPTPQVDKLGGAFSTSSSKIMRQIDGKEPLVIDLSKPEA